MYEREKPIPDQYYPGGVAQAYRGPIGPREAAAHADCELAGDGELTGKIARIAPSRGRTHAAGRLCFVGLPVFGAGRDGGADGGIDAKQNEVAFVGDISLPPLPIIGAIDTGMAARQGAALGHFFFGSSTSRTSYHESPASLSSFVAMMAALSRSPGCSQPSMPS